MEVLVSSLLFFLITKLYSFSYEVPVHGKYEEFAFYFTVCWTWMFMWVCMHMHTCFWRLGVNVRFLSLLFFIIVHISFWGKIDLQLNVKLISMVRLTVPWTTGMWPSLSPRNEVTEACYHIHLSVGNLNSGPCALWLVFYLLNHLWPQMWDIMGAQKKELRAWV